MTDGLSSRADLGVRRAYHFLRLCSPTPTAFAAAAIVSFSLTRSRTAFCLNSSENARRFRDVSESPGSSLSLMTMVKSVK